MMKTREVKTLRSNRPSAITIANRTKDQEINLLMTDWARINRALGRAEEDEFPQGGG